ncbi:peptidoglycan-binding protein, partial [Oceanobacillus kapialis]
MKSRNSLIALVVLLSFFHFSPQTTQAAENTVSNETQNQEIKAEEDTALDKQEIDKEKAPEEQANTGDDQTTESAEEQNNSEATEESSDEPKDTPTDSGAEQQATEESKETSNTEEQQSSEEKNAEDANQKADTETKDLAEEPKRAMLQQRAVEAPDVLEVGVSHPSVVALKEKLNAIGFDGIRETEYYGNWTKTRVEDFQSNYGLPVTGVADSTTLEKLDEVYTSPFQYGKRHENTVDLKEKLNRAGFGYITVTTYYGSFTKNQVAQFQ